MPEEVSFNTMFPIFDKMVSDVDTLIRSEKHSECLRELHLVKTKIEEAGLWLARGEHRQTEADIMTPIPSETISDNVPSDASETKPE